MVLEHSLWSHTGWTLEIPSVLYRITKSANRWILVCLFDKISALESNRSEVSRFCIVNVDYNIKKKNYIRAHTWFNRIDLPRFTSKKMLEEAILFILKNEIFGFGID